MVAPLTPTGNLIDAPGHDRPPVPPPFPVGALIEARVGGPAGEVVVYLRPAADGPAGRWWALLSFAATGRVSLQAVSRATHRMVAS